MNTVNHSPVAPAPHKHLFRVMRTYSATDRFRFSEAVCSCGAIATFVAR
jgi:hypothetical protein